MTETDVLILTARYGSGHLSVANAIRQKLKNENPSVKVVIQDFFELTKPNSYKGIYKRYEILVKHGSWIYNYYYYTKEKSSSFKKLDTMSPMIQRKFNKWLDALKPKIIISTFPVCSGYVSKYKESSGSNMPLVTVITDIVATSEWIYPYTDLYCVATKELKEGLVNKGVSEASIGITGIPIRDSFNREKKRFDLEMLKKLPKEKKLITFIGGGLGLLPDEEELYEWIASMPELHAVIVTGNNKKLYEKLSEKLPYDNIDILGYVHTMDELMKRSTLLIGKPGGITIFEAIVTNLPCVMLKPSLAQEIENCRYLQSKGIGFLVEDSDQLKEVIQQVLYDEALLAKSYQGFEMIRKEIRPDFLTGKVYEWLGEINEKIV